jgi:hypothetical protein
LVLLQKTNKQKEKPIIKIIEAKICIHSLKRLEKEARLISIPTKPNQQTKRCNQKKWQ